MDRSIGGIARPTHRVAKRMITRLEEKEHIDVDHQKFARLALDRSLSKHIAWTLPGGVRLALEEKYSMNFWRAMNTPGDRILVSLYLKTFDDDVITLSKAFAKTGRDLARKLVKSGYPVRHSASMKSCARYTINEFHFEITAHFSSYRQVLQPIVRTLLKPFPQSETMISVAHCQLERYAKALIMAEKDVRQGSSH